LEMVHVLILCDQVRLRNKVNWLPWCYQRIKQSACSELFHLFFWQKNRRAFGLIYKHSWKYIP
jgi:hypothetical protein